VNEGGYQPYKAGQPREQGPALQKMLAGEGSMGNPQDLKRQVQREAPTDAKNAPVRSEVLENFAARYGRPSE
jgi:hypothetical protein